MRNKLLLFSIALWLTCPCTSQAEDSDRKAPTDRLTPEEGLSGWLAIFDGTTTFGFSDASLDRSQDRAALQGGTTTTEFANYELRVRVVRAGEISLGGEVMALSPGEHTRTVRGPRGPIKLGRELVIESLLLKPLDLVSIFNGQNLNGWDRRGRVPGVNQPGARWTVEKGVIHVTGGPEALEYAPAEGPRLFDDFILQMVACTRRDHANGGFFFRNEPGRTMMGYEVQLHHTWYDPAGKKHGYTTGGIDDRQQARAPVAVDHVPFRLTVIAHGPHIATWVNGYQTVDWTDTRPVHPNPRNGLRLQPGTIQLQAHDPETDLEFHGIWLRELPAKS